MRWTRRVRRREHIALGRWYGQPGSIRQRNVDVVTVRARPLLVDSGGCLVVERASETERAVQRWWRRNDGAFGVPLR